MIHWKDNGKPTSAIFKDSHGASVDREGDRSLDEAADFLCAHKPGVILYVTFSDCNACDALVRYLPIDGENPWHSEIHRNEAIAPLTNSQAKHLAKCAVVFRRTQPEQT